MTRVRVQTCAKVNFCLRVLGRRADGYHNVETVLQTVGLWDSVDLVAAPDRAITMQVTSPDAPADESNLCWRAASLMAEQVKTDQGVAITLGKVIPVGAGFGGGSSDAAATLMGLARLWNAALSQEQLEALAATLGADVPFFLRGGCCLARGKGEKLESLPEVAAWLVIVIPERRVSTAQAYAALRRGSTRGRRRDLSRPIRKTIDALKLGTPQALAAALHNDFEAAPMSGIEDALRAKAALMEAGCLGASLSGSGSGAYGIAAGRESAERVAEQLRESWEWVRVAPTVPAGESLMVTETGEDAPQ
jgi:4-diphosphocytidyl-2-C-methyl-D-erythritol kinase